MVADVSIAIAALRLLFDGNAVSLKLTPRVQKSSESASEPDGLVS
jgi:hypothetical protein